MSVRRNGASGVAFRADHLHRNPLLASPNALAPSSVIARPRASPARDPRRDGRTGIWAMAGACGSRYNSATPATSQKQRPVKRGVPRLREVHGDEYSTNRLCHHQLRSRAPFLEYTCRLCPARLTRAITGPTPDARSRGYRATPARTEAFTLQRSFQDATPQETQTLNEDGNSLTHNPN